MPKRKTYSGRFKAQVVAEWINGNKKLADVAEKYGVHPNQIKNWKSTLLKRAHSVLEDKRCNRSPDTAE